MSDVFTIHEARAAIYLADANGDATGEALWIGDCMEKIRIEEDFDETRIERHGRPYASVHHTDESHVITWEKWYAARDEDAALISPELDRHERYVLVLVFHSETNPYWIKRVYRGVTVRSQPLDTDIALTGNVTLRAEQRLMVRGLNTQPDLTATIVGILLWIVAGVETLAYTYNWATETWASTGAIAADVVGVNEGGSGLPPGTDWYLAIDADPVLWLEDDVLRCGTLRAMGDLTLLDAEADRVEFRYDRTTYLIAQADGVIICRNLIETASRPGGGDDFVIRNGAEEWKASLKPGGIRAVDFTEA